MCQQSHDGRPQDTSRRFPAARSAAARSPSKVRGGMGDVESEFVEVWSDEDHARAVGLLSMLSDDGKADAEGPAQVPSRPGRCVAMFRGMTLHSPAGPAADDAAAPGAHRLLRRARAGQEASIIAPVAALDDGDWVVPRIARGARPFIADCPCARYVAQMFGNANDIGKGRQMPVHPDRAPNDLRFLPMSSCVATPAAAGDRDRDGRRSIKGDKTVVLAYLGDGATSAEDFHAGLNFAAVFHAPAVFICLNNQWAHLDARRLPRPRRRPSRSRRWRTASPAVRVDGNDVFAMYRGDARGASTRARRGDGPTFIEAVTYRVGAHSSSDDPTRYRADAEVAEAWEKRDPLLRFRAWLRAHRILDAAGVAAMAAELDDEIQRRDRRRGGRAAPRAADDGRGRVRQGPGHAAPSNSPMLGRCIPAVS